MYHTQEDQGRLTSSPDRSDPYSATDSLQSQPSGTLSSFLRRSLRWPLHAGRVVCGTPCQLARWVHAAVGQAGLHLIDHSEDYGFLYELLSLGMPLLSILHELLGQMYMEAEPVCASAAPPTTLSSAVPRPQAHLEGSEPGASGSHGLNDALVLYSLLKHRHLLQSVQYSMQTGSISKVLFVLP